MQHSPDLTLGIHTLSHGASYNTERAFHLAQAISDWKLLNNESSMIENVKPARKKNTLIKGNLLKYFLSCTAISFAMTHWVETTVFLRLSPIEIIVNIWFRR